VQDVDVGPGGDLYVLQPQDFMVRVFSQDGAPLRSIGRQGEGPGELQAPGRIGFLGDTLWVRDTRARRITFYQRTGEYLGDLQFPEVAGLEEGVQETFGTLAAQGKAVLSTAAGFGADLEGSDHPFPLLAIPREGGTPDTLATLNTAHDRAIFITGSGGEIQAIEVVRQMFSDVTLWDVEADGGGVVVAERHLPTDPDPHYRLTRVGLSGDTVFTIRQPYRPIPIAQERIDSILALYTRGGRSEREIRDVLYLPEHYPPVSQLMAGTDGSIWVGREKVPGQPVDWDIYSAEGSHLANVEVPPGLTVHWTDGQTLWGVETDDLDVPYVVQYGVVRAERP
jgi:hypothetical protein